MSPLRSSVSPSCARAWHPTPMVPLFGYVSGCVRTSPGRVSLHCSHAETSNTQWYRWADYPDHAGQLAAEAGAAGMDLSIGEMSGGCAKANHAVACDCRRPSVATLIPAV